MIFDDKATELLKRDEAEQQKSIDSYSNYVLKKSLSLETESSVSKQASAGAKRVRQNEEDYDLCSRDLPEDDHGKMFISSNEYSSEAPAQKKIKCTTMIEAQHEILQAASYEDCDWYDGAAETMETYDEEFKESAFKDDEVQYTDEFTNYTYDASTMY